MRNTELGDTLDWPYFRKYDRTEADDLHLAGRWFLPRRVTAGIPLDPRVSDVVNRTEPFPEGKTFSVDVRNAIWVWQSCHTMFRSMAPLSIEIDVTRYNAFMPGSGGPRQRSNHGHAMKPCPLAVEESSRPLTWLRDPARGGVTVSGWDDGETDMKESTLNIVTVAIGADRPDFVLAGVGGRP